MRRHKLICLEMTGMVQKHGLTGYTETFTSDGVTDIPQSGDALEDEKLRIYMIQKAREEAFARDRRMRRIRKLARMDFKMIGGVAPIGFYGGAGGGDGGGRPSSMSARS